MYKDFSCSSIPFSGGSPGIDDFDEESGES